MAFPLAIALAFGVSGADAGGVEDGARDWAVVAPAVVEPRLGFIHLSAAAPGPIRAMLVRPGQTVAAGQLLAEQESLAEMAQVRGAEAEVAFRMSERDTAVIGAGAQDRHVAEDALAAATGAVEAARANLDAVRLALSAGDASDQALQDAGATVAARADDREAAERALAMVEMMAKVAPPTRTESALEVARADLAAARAALERTRIRAPSDGTVIEVLKSAGEMADASASDPALVIGDLTGLRLRAEIDERGYRALYVGQSVIARAPALDVDIHGHVIRIANSSRPKRLMTRRPGEPENEGVVEVLVDIDVPAGLLPGSRVDAFFVPAK